MVFLPQVSPPKPCMHPSPPIPATCLASLILDLITRIVFGEEYRSLNSSLCSLPSEVQKLINSIWNKEELPEFRSQSLSTAYKNFIQHSAVEERYMQRKFLIISMDFDTAGQLLIIYSAFVKYLIKNGNTVKHCISYS